MLPVKIPCQYSMVCQHLFLVYILPLSLAFGQNLSLLAPNSSYLPKAITEWTAMGDSYASGIGAGARPQHDPNLCFRYSNAYPEILQSGQGSLRPNPGRYNFVACSGAKFAEILVHQLDQHDRPGWPAWGTAPEFVTITMGGNDIGILPLVLTCIYSIKVPFGKECDDVIQQGFENLDSDEFKDGLADVIRTVRDQGRRQQGSNFHIFVTGYAQFFNSETSQCNGVTFGAGLSLLPAQYLTRDRRRRMNQLAVALNRLLETAVGLFPDDVTYVDYDALFEGHRFCDRFEPNANDDETWFFALSTTSDPTNQATGLEGVHGTNRTEGAGALSLPNITLPFAAGLLADDQGVSTPRHVLINVSRAQTISALSAVDGNSMGQPKGGENAALGNIWRVFHPKSRGHQAIRNAVIQAVHDVQLSRAVAATKPLQDTS